MKSAAGWHFVAVFGMVLLLVVPAGAMADAWVPTPLPSKPASSETGYPGFDGPEAQKEWPAFDTDRWPDSWSCQLALNKSMNAVHNTLVEIPAATTDEERAFGNSVAAAINVNSQALADLRPICLAKPPPNTPIEVTFKPRRNLVETADSRYVALKLGCTDYPECTVRGTTIVDLITGGAIGRVAFRLSNQPVRTVRVPLTQAGRTMLEAQKSLKARLIIRTNGLIGRGPPLTTRQSVTIKLTKR